MHIIDKMKTYNFWISLVSAILLVARILGDKFGFEIDSSLVMDVTTAMCGVFVVLGIISAPQKVVTKYIENNKTTQQFAEPVAQITPSIEAVEENKEESNQEPQPEVVAVSEKEVATAIEAEIKEEQETQEAVQEPSESVGNLRPHPVAEDFSCLSREELIDYIASIKNN
ncbi:MAG: hypothetical protein IJS68_03385 [Clostridia bacterium]|nr:hypothetical protein [Clostridia bacterium]